MPPPLNNDDTYDLIYYLVAPSHPQSPDYLNDLLDASCRLYDHILSEYTRVLGYTETYKHRADCATLKRHQPLSPGSKRQ